MNWQIIVGIIIFLGGLANIATDFGAFAFGIILGALITYWGLIKKGYLKNPLSKILPSKPTPNSNHTSHSETFQLAGVYYYNSNISRVAIPNPMWNYKKDQILAQGMEGSTIYRYKKTHKPATLRDEPNNPHDKNAVAVYMDNLLVGYIKKDDIARVKSIRRTRSVKSIIGCITGGEFKTVYEHSPIEKDMLSFSISITIEYA